MKSLHTFSFLILLLVHNTTAFIRYGNYRSSNSIGNKNVNSAGIDTLESAVDSSRGNFADSFVAQKNFVLMEKLMNPAATNLTEIVTQYINFCDESFDVFLNSKIAAAETEKEKQVFGKVRYEINCARQRKLIEADKILRGILSAGGLKQMEAKLAYHLKRYEVDMAFNVILNLNIEDAIEQNAETAYKVMKHLQTMINEYQDSIVSSPVRLLRLLVRTDDSNIRKQMLRQKLIFKDGRVNTISVVDKIKGDGEPAMDTPQDTMSPQCEHIVVKAVESWGAADVHVKELEDTIVDVLAQVSTISISILK